MKKMLLFAGAVALTFTPVGLPSAAAAKHGPSMSASDICGIILGAYGSSGMLPFGDLNGCLQYIQAAGAGSGAADLCRGLRTGGYLGDYNLNQGQCVSFLKTQGNSSDDDQD
jgi:hypothetical protein